MSEGTFSYVVVDIDLRLKKAHESCIMHYTICSIMSERIRSFYNLIIHVTTVNMDVRFIIVFLFILPEICE